MIQGITKWSQLSAATPKATAGESKGSQVMIYRILVAVRSHPTCAILTLAVALALGAFAHFLLTAAVFIRIAETAEARRSEPGASLQTARDAVAEIDHAKPMFALGIMAEIAFGGTGLVLGVWGACRKLKGER